MGNNYCMTVNLWSSVRGPDSARGSASEPPAAVHVPTAPIRRPRATEVEQHGIDTIPPEHRHSGPFDLFRIQFGGANTFATVILGHLPGPARAVAVAGGRARPCVGVVVGALILMPMGLFGPLTGTNNAVSLRRALRRPRPGAGVVPLAAHRDRVLLDLGVGQRRRRRRRPDPAVRHRRLRPAARRRLRRPRRAGDRRGRLRLRVHAAGQQGRRGRQHRADPAGRRRLRRRSSTSATTPAPRPTRWAASGRPSCSPR